MVGTKRTIQTLGAIGAILSLVLLAAKPTWAADAEKPAAKAKSIAAVKEFTLAAVIIDDAKFWLPSTIVVEEGDHVKLTLKNMAPGAVTDHGFSIPAYNITEVVERGKPKTVEFNADKAGVFPYICQLHPAHIGGQLIVHKKACARPAAKK